MTKKLCFFLTENVAIICTALTKEWMNFFLQRLNLFSNLNSIFYFRTKDQNMLYRNQTYHSYTRSMLVNLMEDISKESEDVCELGIVSKNISYSAYYHDLFSTINSTDPQQYKFN